MMRVITLVAIILSIFVCELCVQAYASELNEGELQVIVAYNPSLTDDAYVLDTYKSVLEEEGIPYQLLSLIELMSAPPANIVKHAPAVIFPDGASQIAPDGFFSWLSEYVESGGNAAVIYDVGVKDSDGNYLPEAVLTDLIGINYTLYDKLLDDAYTIGHLKFKDDKSRDFFEIPVGKVVSGNFLSSYKYGALEYPIARNEAKTEPKDDDIYAYVQANSGEVYPGIVLKSYGQGHILYVDLPLGYLKGSSDDLPMRAVLRTFLFKEVKIPHLVNTPYGKGGLVINWHVDWAPELKSLPAMIRDGYMRKDLKYSIHITAGDYKDIPGDNLGFDACGKGKKLVKKLKKYGTIGSHGGWGHDWFAGNILSGKFGEKEIEEYINMNNRCLERITKRKVTEYSAPVGVHPQPTVTKILEKLGIIAYYCTGDTGSAPNRTFIDRKKVSDKVIAFPIMPLGKAASLWELEAVYDTSEQEVKQWLVDTADYASKNRTIRLIYSHPYDLYEYEKHCYQKVLNEFLDHLEELQKSGKLVVQPMSYFAEFMLRYLKTDYTFRPDGNDLEVSLKNEDGLDGIAVAIPKNRYKKPEDKSITVEEDDSYYYLVIGKKNDTKILHISAY